MDILAVGLSHKSAPLEVLERSSYTKERLADALHSLKDFVGESIILSTCNRTEVYTSSDSPERATARIAEFIARDHGMHPETIEPHLFAYRGEKAVRHLLGVAGGLDSLIVGESQILGQVREALSAASGAGLVDTPLVGLFHAAVRTGRRVREETDVGRNALSISYAGVQLAQRRLGSLRDMAVLLVGAGEAGALVARALRTVGVQRLVIANRTRARAEELADSLGGDVAPFSKLEEALVDADIVIASTDSPEFVIDRRVLSSALDRRARETLFLIDLAVPRDIDPSAADMDGVELFNIDDLSSIAEENLETRKRAAEQAELIVDEETARFMRWRESLDAAPIIKTIHQQAERIREREVQHALREMPGISREQAEVVDALTRSIVRKLLHDPTVFLRDRADKAQLQAARDLFSLMEEADSPQEAPAPDESIARIATQEATDGRVH